MLLSNRIALASGFAALVLTNTVNAQRQPALQKGEEATTHTVFSSANGDPRTRISELPYTIDEPGSYYLAAHLTAMQGITVDAPYVTIDLNGFSLIGEADNTSAGIAVGSAGGAGFRLRVFNGNIATWSGWGIDVRTGTAQSIENVTMGFNGSGGISTGPNAIISDCILNDIGGVGIDARANTVMRNCVINGSDGDGYNIDSGSVLQGCVSIDAGSKGFNALADARDLVLRDCIARGAASDGFQLDGGSVATSCVAAGNGAHGFNTFGTQLENCVARANDSNGFHVDYSTVYKALALGNQGNGMRLDDFCVVGDLQAIGNEVRGVYMNGIRSIVHRASAGANTTIGFHFSSNSAATQLRQYWGGGNAGGMIVNNGDSSNAWDLEW